MFKRNIEEERERERNCKYKIKTNFKRSFKFTVFI